MWWNDFKKMMDSAQDIINYSSNLNMNNAAKGMNTDNNKPNNYDSKVAKQNIVKNINWMKSVDVNAFSPINSADVLSGSLSASIRQVCVC